MYKKTKQLNLYLIFGIIFTSILVIIGVFGNFLAPYSESETIISIIDPVTQEIKAAPFAPSFAHWLGTDHQGIDLVSKIFRGAKYTLLVVLAVGLSRLAFALPIGLIAGYWPQYLKTPISYINRAWTSMPLFIFVYILIEPVINYSLDKTFQIFFLWIVLTLAGLPPLIETIRGHVERINGFEFIKGVKVLGAGPLYIFRRHIIPHLKSNLIIILSLEMAQILWLLGQLGVFHIFVGGTIAVYDDLVGITHYYSKTNEWAGLLGYGRKYILTAPWIPLAPAIAFTFGIFSFTLLAEGIKKSINKNPIKYDFE